MTWQGIVTVRGSANRRILTVMVCSFPRIARWINNEMFRIRRATDADGNMLLDATPPPLRCDLPPNDWTPFSSGVEFLLADFLFRKVQMSASNINELLKYWAQSVTQDE